MVTNKTYQAAIEGKQTAEAELRALNNLYCSESATLRIVSQQRVELGEELRIVRAALSIMEGECRVLREQKIKDDLNMDWFRHRVNALEKQNAVLMQKAAGIAMPVAEIVSTRPGTMTVPDFQHLPSFEDVGDDEAKRLGVEHDTDGTLVYKK